MTLDASVSVSQLIDAAAATLRRAGLDESRREALWLWRALGHDPAGWRTPSAASDVAGFERAVARRAAGEPFAYVVGSGGFRHLSLACDGRVLIPRPETEELVDLALDRVRSGAVIDVGTGSGAIALSLRMEGDYAHVLGVDIAPDALEVARGNGAASGLPVDWLCGDLLEGFAEASADLIVANPPYISGDEYAALDPSVRDYEPVCALVSGDDGMTHTRRLLVDAPRVLRPGGWLVLELDCRRAQDTARLATDCGWQSVTVTDDLFGRARYLAARQGAQHD